MPCAAADTSRIDPVEQIDDFDVGKILQAHNCGRLDLLKIEFDPGFHSVPIVVDRSVSRAFNEADGANGKFPFHLIASASARRAACGSRAPPHPAARNDRPLGSW